MPTVFHSHLVSICSLSIPSLSQGECGVGMEGVYRPWEEEEIWGSFRRWHVLLLSSLAALAISKYTAASLTLFSSPPATPRLPLAHISNFSSHQESSGQTCLIFIFGYIFIKLNFIHHITFTHICLMLLKSNIDTLVLFM